MVGHAKKTDRTAGHHGGPLAWRAEYWGPVGWLVIALSALVGTAATPTADVDVRPLVAEIRRADYAGERDSLERLYERLAPLPGSDDRASALRYWRGFAMWRRAFNGFNESTTSAELEHDLSRALEEFEAAIASDSSFVEAWIGAGSCASNLMFLHRDDPERATAWIAKGSQMLRAARSLDAGNPRLLWVQGANVWHLPPEYGGGHDKALAMYRSGLARARAEWESSDDPLAIDWGEPELLMNLAWAHLNDQPPRPDSAEVYARAALARVPHWHYVKDILLPQIAEAKP